MDDIDRARAFGMNYFQKKPVGSAAVKRIVEMMEETQALLYERRNSLQLAPLDPLFKTTATVMAPTEVYSQSGFARKSVTAPPFVLDLDKIDATVESQIAAERKRKQQSADTKANAMVLPTYILIVIFVLLSMYVGWLTGASFKSSGEQSAQVSVDL